jgi:hypothetical protein
MLRFFTAELSFAAGEFTPGRGPLSSLIPRRRGRPGTGSWHGLRFPAPVRSSRREPSGPPLVAA